MSLPVFPLNTVLFPGIPLPLRIFEDRYLRLLRDRMANDPVFGIALIESGDEAGDEPDFHRVGTTARLVSINAIDHDLVEILVVGERRVRLGRGDWRRGYAVADADELPDRRVDLREATIRFGEVRAFHDRYLALLARAIGIPYQSANVRLDVVAGCFDIASRLPLHTWEQQHILEDRDPLSRIGVIHTKLRREITLIRQAGPLGDPILPDRHRFLPN